MRQPITIVLLPGGPGLSPEHLLPWARSARKNFGARVTVLDYSAFARPSNAPRTRRFAEGLSKLETAIRKFAPRGASILIGHSFGARIALELLKKNPKISAAAVLVNCPGSFESSREFVRRKRRLVLPETIDDEQDFRRYWRGVLPLYFHIRPKAGEIKSLSRKTRWMETAWLTTVIQGGPKTLGASTQRRLLFINGREDARFPASNLATLRKAFPRASHKSISGCGHFPMMEKPDALTALILDRLQAHKFVDL